MKKSLASFLLVFLTLFLLESDNFVVPVSASSESEIKEFISDQFGQEMFFSSSNNFEISNTPSDDYFKYQWYLNKIKAVSAWRYVQKSPEVTIAIIDAGVQIDHPDLRDNIWFNPGEISNNQIDDDNNGFIDDVFGWDFINNLPDPSPKFEANFNKSGISHGTIVAGIAAARGDNNTGIVGVTWEANIMSLRVLDDQGRGGANGVIRAIDYAINNGADIINLSFVGLGRSDSMREAILRAHRAGVIIVAAAGNEQKAGEGYDLDKTPMYPICYDNELEGNVIIGVGATDPLDQKANFSSYGNCVDIMAPGTSIFSTVTYAPNKMTEDGNLLDSKYDGFWSGTSMATPMVTGALALIMATNPDLDSEQVKQVLLSTADNIDRLNPSYFGKVGVGRLNVEAAVKKALDLSDNGEAKILLTPQSGALSQVKISDYSNKVIKNLEAFPFVFSGGINVAGGDISGNGLGEIVVSPGLGGGPQVRIFSSKEELLSQFFAYDTSFRGGVNLAVGDVTGDGQAEIITGAGPGGGPHVRVFNSQGQIINSFYAYNKTFEGGVNIGLINIK